MSNIDNFLRNPKFEFVNEDLLEFSPSRHGDFDEIYHMASPASPPKYMSLPMQTMKVNTLGTELLCELAIKNEARILFASTSEIYGDPLVHPQDESYYGNVNTLGPRSVYDESKRFGETLLTHFHQSRGANVVIVRIFNTYGPQMDPFDGRVVSTFLRQTLLHEPLTVYGTGKQTRSFCYVSDLIVGLELAMASNNFGPFNLGNPREFSIIELIGRIENLVGTNLNYRLLNLPVDDPKVRCPDISRAKQILGWNPNIEIEEGLQLTFDWMKQRVKLR